MIDRLVRRGIDLGITGGMIITEMISNIAGDNNMITEGGIMDVVGIIGTNRSRIRHKLITTLTTIRDTLTSNTTSSTRHKVTNHLLTVTSTISVKITKCNPTNTISTIVKRETNPNSNNNNNNITITISVASINSNNSSNNLDTITIIKVGIISTISKIITIDCVYVMGLLA